MGKIPHPKISERYIYTEAIGKKTTFHILFLHLDLTFDIMYVLEEKHSMKTVSHHTLPVTVLV